MTERAEATIISEVSHAGLRGFLLVLPAGIES